MAKRLHVVAAVIADKRGRILLAKRPAEVHQGGLWEFPGGKVESDEATELALVRELQEELGIIAESFRPLIRVSHDYPDRKVLLDVWRVNGFSGSAHGAEGQEIRWVEPDSLDCYQFPAANKPIVAAARLPDSYLITPEPGPASLWDEFLSNLSASLEAGVWLVQFRARKMTAAAYRQLASLTRELCHEMGVRVMLNGHVELAHELGFDGVHLRSDQLQCWSKDALADDKLLVAASCHNAEELSMASETGCDFAVLGPVKQTATHPEATSLGWLAFQAMTSRCDIPVYALGGMTRADYEQAWCHGAQGIAAIRSLWREVGSR